MPRRTTTTPADEGIRAAAAERTAAFEQEAQAFESQTADTAPAATAPMSIEVRITSTRNLHDNPIRATASVVLGDAMVIKGFKVTKGENGLFVSMPARRLQDGTYSKICNPITKEFAAQLSASVLNEYQVYLAQQMAESQAAGHDLNGPDNDLPFDAPDPDPGSPFFGGM